MIQTFKKIFNPLTYVSKGNLPIVALCFFIAFSFWMVKTLNKRYNSKIGLPIAFRYNKDKIYTQNKLPNKLWVDAQSTGWILLQHKLGLKSDSLIFNIGNFFETSQTISKEDITRFINNNVKGVLVNQILENDFVLRFERIVNKNIKLSIKTTDLKYSKSLKLRNFSINPTELNIKGPSSVLNTIQSIYTLQVPVDSADTSLRQAYDTPVTFDSSVVSNYTNIKVLLIFARNP